MRKFITGLLMLLSFGLFAQNNEPTKPVKMPVYSVSSEGKIFLPTTSQNWRSTISPNITNAVITAEDWNLLKNGSGLTYHVPESIITVPERQMSVIYGNGELYNLQQLTVTINLLVKEVNRLTAEVQKLKKE